MLNPKFIDDMKKYLLILNPMAGRGKGQRLYPQIERWLHAQLGEVDVQLTRYSGHARELAAQFRDAYDVLIAAGGDGTVHEVVNGMMGGKATLAVIPIGSGNDFVKMLHLPLEPQEAIRVIARNQRMKVDVGKVGDRYFPNGLGIGFDAWVVRESKKVKHLRGFLIYLYSVLKTTFLYRNQRVLLEVDGKRSEHDIFLIAVGNGKAMGGGFYLTPHANIQDGLFDVCIIHALTKKDIFLNLPKATKGEHLDMPQVEMFRTAQLKVSTPEGIAAHADGELLGMELKELDVSLLPAALEVIYQPSADKER